MGTPATIRATRLATLVGAGIMASGAVAMGAPTGPSAIGPTFLIEAELHHRCVRLPNPTGTDPVTVIQRRDGTAVARDTVSSTANVEVCLTRLRAGDRLAIRQAGMLRRTIVIPSITASIDIGGNLVTGRVPTTNLVVDLWGNRDIAGLEVASFDDRPEVAADGTFQHRPGIVLTRGDAVTVRWQTGDGDDFRLYVGTPSVVVRNGSPAVDGLARRGSRPTITLMDGDVIRGRFSQQLPGYEVVYRGFLRRAGAKVKASGGDRVFHSQVPGAMLTVLPRAMIVDPADNGTVTTTCFPNGPFFVSLNDGDRTESTTSSSGRVEVSNLSQNGGDLVPGDVVLVACENAKGGGQIRTMVVP